MDVIVANDTVQNFLFHNQRDGTFRERAMDSGIAFDTNGGARGAMGVACGRVRNNDERCIVIGNFANEMSAFYVSKNEKMQFLDEANSCGLGPITREYLTFGVLFIDFDLDGRQDHVCANGHLEEDINRVQESQHYEQPAQLFWNGGTEYGIEFIPMTAANCGEDLLQPMVGRGAASADIDGDGDVDLVLTASGREPRLLRNDQHLGRHWLRVKLSGTKCHHQAIGSWVEVHAGGGIQYQQVMPTCSYLSQVELPLTFGLGQNVEVDKVVVRWVDGSVQEVLKPAIDQLLHIEQDSSAVDVATAAE
jgi:hypothetical protein